MATGRQDWQQNRQNRQDDRQDFRNENREDWQNWADDKHDNYGDWYHGSWYPGAGWGYMWDNYPVAAAVGMTAWGINRIGYGWGYSSYDNPYYAESSGSSYDYSEPLVVYSDSASAGSDVASAAPNAAAQPTDPGMAAFDAARSAFYSGDYATALAQLDTTLKTMPNDAVVHEFRSLVLFALQKYPESAAAIYAVLAAGPGWDWTTMSSLYPSVDAYSKQLRSLEDFVRANPQSPDGRFLVGYHYMTNGYADAASKQFKLAQGLLPNDKLIGQLVAMTTPADPSKQVAAAAAPTPPPANAIKADQFVGAWKASAQGSDFQLDLGQDGSFTWTYTKGKRKQSIKGVYAVDQNNLALETSDGGGTMLAQVDFTNPSQFTFKMVGDGPKDPGLEFKRS